jgi:hypothetical protein
VLRPRKYKSLPNFAQEGLRLTYINYLRTGIVVFQLSTGSLAIYLGFYCTFGKRLQTVLMRSQGCPGCSIQTLLRRYRLCANKQICPFRTPFCFNCWRGPIVVRYGCGLGMASGLYGYGSAIYIWRHSRLYFGLLFLSV